MGYLLNELANLPVDKNVKFYIFVVNGRFRDSLFRTIEENFASIAKDIGSQAVIARGLDAKAFHSQIARAYFGQDGEKFLDLLPALIVTNAHPDNFDEKSVRLVIPLDGVEDRFGGWANFFRSLTEFVQGKDNSFVKKFEEKDSVLRTAKRFVSVKPGMFGISINGDELMNWWLERRNAR